MIPRRPARTLLPVVILVLVLVRLVAPARADDKSALSPSRLSLPKGPGSLGGVGENIEPSLGMGLMHYGVNIALPTGYDGMTPSLDLAYNSGAPGAGELGIGWSIPLAFVQRMTARGLPAYTAADTFASGESDELVPIPGGSTYRSRFEGEFVRYTWMNAGGGAAGYWKAEYPDGRVGFFGARADGTPVPEATTSDATRIFRYYLVEMVDPLGHRVVYDYGRDAACPRLERISWVFVDATPRFQAVLTYENRYDPIRDGRPGFEVVCGQRLSAIEVLSRGQQLRRYDLAYEAPTTSPGVSRLQTVTQFGLQKTAGGQAMDNPPLPIVFGFSYTSGLDETVKTCAAAACVSPRVVPVPGSLGLDFRAGTAELLDFNGDAIPDVIDTAGPRHELSLGAMNASGAISFAAPFESKYGSARIGQPNVQIVDLDGNGFADLADLENHRVLWNYGNGDWTAEDRGTELFMPDFSIDANLRFFDFDGDKRMDLMHSDAASTFYYVNNGDGRFTSVDGNLAIGVAFADGLQLADMNGDGLLDAVRLIPGTVSYWLNLGRGNWGARHDMSGLPANMETTGHLVDLDGDGLADVVSVVADSVQVVFNRAGTTLVAGPPLRASATLPIPDATSDVSIRFADMNGSGSTDIVWITASGSVTYLELFPQRPNLLSAVTNGIGASTSVSYGSSTAHLARDGGAAAWPHRLPHPVLTVNRIDATDTHTNVHQVSTFRYHDGYYDGKERQFRGFGRVEVDTPAEDSVEAGHVEHTFDVGDLDVYRKGLRLTVTTASGGAALSRSATEYQDCPPAGIPQGLSPAVRFVCPGHLTTTIEEGLGSDSSVTTEEQYGYDGYGNRTLISKLGVTQVGAGGGGCGACPSRPAGSFGAACGAQCLGDEHYEETTFIAPAAGGPWILHRPLGKRIYGAPASAETHEEQYFYDGPAFVGLPAGQLTHGLLTRTTARVDTKSDRVIPLQRLERDANGAVVTSQDANGHITEVGYDSASLLITSETRVLDDPGHTPYALRMSVNYEPVLDLPIESIPWMRVTADGPPTPPPSTLYHYDEFGRLATIARPGDDLQSSPTQTFAYDLGDPVSRIRTYTSSQHGQPADMESVQCFDGRGRKYQTLTQIASGLYQASGYAVVNGQGSEAATYQPHQTATDRCALAAPAGVRFAQSSYDATGRLQRTILPDAADHGGVASETRVEYQPLQKITWDEEDTDPSSPHAGTLTTVTSDGLGRMVTYERILGGDRHVATQFFYDGLGDVGGFQPVSGPPRVYAYDLLGRLIGIDDPDAGRTTMILDDAGNVTARSDDRGITANYAFDEVNRTIAVWQDGDEANTKATFGYDFADGCSPPNCDFLAGKLAMLSYPLDAGAQGRDTFRYDARDQPVYQSRTLDGQTFEFMHDFDNAGRQIGTTYPGAHHITWNVDPASRLASIPGLVEAFTYDDRSLPRTITLSSGATASYGHDLLGRPSTIGLKSSAAADLLDLTYFRDRVGNLLNVVDAATPADAASWNAGYDYDDWYRLAHAMLDPDRAAHAETLSFEYDDLDNVTSKTSTVPKSPEQIGRYSYDPDHPHRATMAGATKLGYDDAGDVTMLGDATYAWDFLGRLDHAARGDHELGHYRYLPDGTRVKKVEPGGVTAYYVTPDFELRDGVATIYVQAGTQRIAKLEFPRDPPPSFLPDLAPFDVTDGAIVASPDQQITAADAWAAEGVVTGVFTSDAAVDATTVDALLAAAARRMLLAGENDRTTYLHEDPLGTLLMTTDAGGQPVAQETQYPHGSHRAGADASYEDYRFTGKEFDAESGLYYFGARYYSSVMGRFASPDPLQFTADQPPDPQRWNPYAYARNNPLSNVDPDGRDAIAIAFVDYKAKAMGVHWPGTGHAGLVTIDSRGNTKYFEYGRYDHPAEKGVVQTLTVPNVMMKDGRPTDASLKRLLNSIAKQEHNYQGTMEGAYFQTSDKQTKEIDNYASGRLADNKDPGREPYNTGLMGKANNCATFVRDALDTAQLNTSGSERDIRPKSMISDVQNNADETLSYQVKDKKLDRKNRE